MGRDTKIIIFTGRCCFLFLLQELNFLSQDLFLLSQEKNPPFVTGVILPVTGSFSCDMGIFHHVIGNVPPIKRSTVFL